MRRSDIRATIARFENRDSALAEVLERILRSMPLQKPAGFVGSEENDFFYLDLSPSELEDIREALADVEIDQCAVRRSGARFRLHCFSA
jgi:hypothetical protein